MNYEHTEALIKLLNGALAAYMWTYLIPIAAPKRKMRRARTVYALLIMAVMFLIDWSFHLLTTHLHHAVPAALLPSLSFLSGILIYLIALPLLSTLMTSQRPRRCFGIGALVLLTRCLSDFLLLLFFWFLWFPDRPLKISAALLPSATRVVMMVAVQSVMYLLLLCLHLISRPRESRRVWYLIFFPIWGICVSNVLLYFLIRRCGRPVTTTVLLCTVVSNLVLVISTNQLLRFTDQYFSYQKLLQRHARSVKARAMEKDYAALSQAQTRELEEVCEDIRHTLHDAFPPDGTPAAGPAQAQRPDRSAHFGPVYQPVCRALPACAGGGNRRRTARRVEYVRASAGEHGGPGRAQGGGREHEPLQPMGPAGLCRSGQKPSHGPQVPRALSCAEKAAVPLTGIAAFRLP